eukprot:2234822-Prorocentrum_lima.AAC.1
MPLNVDLQWPPGPLSSPARDVSAEPLSGPPAEQPCDPMPPGSDELGEGDPEIADTPSSPNERGQEA